MNIHSTKRKKPAKPCADFPLFPHATRQQAKKSGPRRVCQKLHYFGPVTDDETEKYGAMAGLAKYQEQAVALHAGRTPGPPSDGLIVPELLNRFLSAKKHLVDTQHLRGLPLHLRTNRRCVRPRPAG